jgi:activator of HSP90 ATPase
MPRGDTRSAAMTPAIQQSVEFDAPPEALFEIYMDSKKHSEATGSNAKLGRKAGTPFSAFKGLLRGKNLLIVPKKMIVQAWRSAGWKKTDPDSILILTFTKTPTGGRVDMVHANVPEHDHAGVTKGWNHFYWEPWRAYIAAHRR